MGRDWTAPYTALAMRISIHSPRMGRDNLVFLHGRRDSGFQSTLPAWGETSCAITSSANINTFQSTLPAWGETVRSLSFRQIFLFQSTLPAWGETEKLQEVLGIEIFQSTLPAWGETFPRNWRRYHPDISIHSPRMGRDFSLFGAADGIAISIHSPRMGRDYSVGGFRIPRLISIHSPRMGRDLMGGYVSVRHVGFQSTLPAWGETLRLAGVWRETKHFNPLSPHGERLGNVKPRNHSRHFNPLSPHGERPSSAV